MSLTAFHTVRQTESTATAERERLRPGEYAVLANANARGFKRAEKAGAFALVPRQDLYLSRSLTHSELLIRELVDKGYRAIFAAGGDGTIAHLLNELRVVVPNPARQPMVGVVRMGTGNAIADFTGASAAATDLQQLALGSEVEPVRVAMVETEGILCPFSGCGVDAGVLNDYIKLKDSVSGTVLERALTGVQGYLAAGVLKTAPEAIAPSRRRRVFVVNEGPVAYAVNKNGDVVDTYRRGAVLYSGEITMACAGSIPFYGYKMRMLPSADRLPGFFQLRLAHMHPFMAVARLPKLWRGQLDRQHGTYDFLAQRVRLEFDGDIPFQISGDAAGYRREVSFRLSERTFRFVRPTSAAADVAATPITSTWSKSARIVAA